MSISMTTVQRPNPIGFANKIGCRKSIKNGSKEIENRLDVLLSTEQVLSMNKKTQNSLADIKR